MGFFFIVDQTGFIAGPSSGMAQVSAALRLVEPTGRREAASLLKSNGIPAAQMVQRLPPSRHFAS